MAVAYSVRDDASFLSGASFTSASFTPANGVLVTLLVGSTMASGTPNTPTVSGWTQLGSSFTCSILNTNDSKLSVFYKIGNGSAQTATIAFGGQSQYDGAYTIDEWTGTATTNGGADAFPQAIVTQAGASWTSFTATLNALRDSGSMAVGFLQLGVNQSVTPGSGFTLRWLWGAGPATGSVWGSVSDTNATSVSASWGSATSVGAIALEIAGPASVGMVVTNQTTTDYWFGPLHLNAGVGQTLVVDDRTDTSLYLYDDEVADPLNNLFLAGKITVSGAASPFPRPTGEAEVLRGDGSPEGRLFAPQGSGYLRRDTTGAANAFYVKTTGVEVGTGWDSIASELVGSITGTYDLVSSTAETSLISGLAASSTTGFRIPAKTIPVDGAMRLTLVGDYLNSTGANQTCTLRIKFGGTVFYGDAVGSIASNATRHPARIEFVLANLNATNSNLLMGEAPAWGGGAPAAGSIAGSYGGIGDARLVTSGIQTIDTTLDQYLDVTAVHSANSPSLSIRRLAAFAELL
jgi:hypothetical protein